MPIFNNSVEEVLSGSNHFDTVIKIDEELDESSREIVNQKK